MSEAKLKIKLDYYEAVRQKLAVGPLHAPKHEKIYELLQIFWPDEETIKLLTYFPSVGEKITLNELVEKTGLEKKVIRKTLKNATKKKTVSLTQEGYGLEPLVPGIFEAYFIARQDSQENIQKAAEIYRWLFINAGELEKQGLSLFDKDFELFRPLLPIETREKLIKIDESIDSKSYVLPYELVEDLINKNDYWAYITCQCRLIGEMNGEPCERAPAEMGCFITGRGARGLVSFGWATALESKEAAIEYLKKTEKAGLVHLTSNSKGGEHLMFICNCCPCHCGALMPAKKHGFKSAIPSNFRPKIDVEVCVECETCLKKCPMDAISHPEEGKMVINSSICIGCGVCAMNCPKSAITMEKTSNKIPKDKNPIGKKMFMQMLGELLMS
ncbi:MAG: ATP-binding protein [Candidatus Helarchaeota archaeon]